MRMQFLLTKSIFSFFYCVKKIHFKRALTCNFWDFFYLRVTLLNWRKCLLISAVCASHSEQTPAKKKMYISFFRKQLFNFWLGLVFFTSKLANLKFYCKIWISAMHCILTVVTSFMAFSCSSLIFSTKNGATPMPEIYNSKRLCKDHK